MSDFQSTGTDAEIIRPAFWNTGAPAAPITFRRATAADVPALRDLHRFSMYTLAAAHYSRAEMDGYFAEVETVDPDMIADGTYLVAEAGGRIAASGGWTMRRPSYANLIGQAGTTARTSTIRAIFVHPDFAGRRLGRTLLELSESESVLIGRAHRIELCATLCGYPLYARSGYQTVAPLAVALANGETFRSIRMVKDVWTVPTAEAA